MKSNKPFYMEYTNETNRPEFTTKICDCGKQFESCWTESCDDCQKVTRHD